MNPAALESLVVSKFGPAEHSMGSNGLELIVACPICGEKKLTINTVNGIYKCWRGCMSGTVRKLFSGEVLGKEDATLKARRLLAQRKLRDAKSRGIPSPGELVDLEGLGPEHPASIYLRSRGVDPKTVSEFGVKYCREGRSFAKGLFDTTNTIVSLIESDGELVGWQSRLMYNPDAVDDRTCESLGFQRKDDGGWKRPPKYFTSPGFDKGKTFFNYDNARKGRIVVVCEGVFDVFAVGRCAVAALGKSLSDTQISLLKDYWDLVVLLLDPEAESDIKALNKKLHNSIPVVLNGYKDAGEAPRDEIWRQICEKVDKNPEMVRNNMSLLDLQFRI